MVTFFVFKYQRFNNLILNYNSNNWSEEQQETHDLIKSLHESSLGYRKIAQHLNDKDIKTHTGKEWGETGNSVYSVLKKYSLREERLELLNREYELE